MEQLSLFDFSDGSGNNVSVAIFTEQQEEELKRAMALAIIEMHRKETDDYEKRT